jgi:drug/metabolite transporter (DMT)-like permease
LNKLIDKIPFKQKGLIYISVAALLWSSSGLFIKISGRLELNAFQISFFRSLIAAITIISISTFQKKKIKFEFDVISIFCAISYSGILIFFVIANTLTTAANTIFLQFTAPIYLLFLEPFFLKTKFQMKNLITVVVCILGMALFFMGRLETGNLYGNMFGILSGISFALFSLFLKWKKQIHKTENTLSQIAMGNILVAIICFPIIIGKLIISPVGFVILSFLGIFQIGISYVIYNEGIKYVSATESLIIAMLEAVFNPFWVYIGIGESPSNYALLGGAVILIGIVAHNFIIKGKPEEKIYPEAG